MRHHYHRERERDREGGMNKVDFVVYECVCPHQLYGYCFRPEPTMPAKLKGIVTIDL